MTRLVPLVRHPVTIAGAAIATASAVGFVVLAIAVLAGLFDNPYAGLVIGIALPALLVLGLLLVPAGMRLERRRQARHPDAPRDWPVLDFRVKRVRRVALAFAALTAANVVIVLLGAYSSLRWMESPAFCGQTCHTPMQPQFTAWQASAHASTACVRCHIGDGPGAFVHAKLAGVRQLGHVIAGSYAKPTPPGTDMPPGAQAATCVGCHSPARLAGDRIRVIREYADDAESSETSTTLRMRGSAIHWHANPANRVEYLAIGQARETIPYVKVTDESGRTREYASGDASDEVIRTAALRTMDCIDCHNTVGHPMMPTAERAVDAAIAGGRISRDLPHGRREAVRLVKAAYAEQDAGAQAIERELRMLYASRGGPPDEQSLARTVTALQAIYRRNVFPSMRVTWGSYPDNRGHTTSTGCFRCHDGAHVDKSGSAIEADCETCHTEVTEPPSEPDTESEVSGPLRD